jgi:hypothetical protein
MTTEPFTPTPDYTVAGFGPYAVTHPYAQGAVEAFVIVDGARLQLTLAEYSLSPVESITTGNLFLTPATATTHAGRALIIERRTSDEQGWLGVQGEREAGLEAQLDRIVQSVQEIRQAVAGALRIRETVAPFDWADGTVPIRQGSRVVSGPTSTEISAAQARATEAAASAAAAAASAAAALARELSMLRDRGDWITATAYTPSDIVTQAGSAYICILSHTSGTFATDLGANRWRLFASKGDAGAGTGDMLKTENLSGLTNVGQARTNLGLAIGAQVQAYDVELDQLAAPAYVRGDIIRRGAAGLERLAKGTPTQFLGGDGTDTLWRPKSKVCFQQNILSSGTDSLIAALPANLTEFKVCIDFLSGSVVATPFLRLGTSGGLHATGYTAARKVTANASSPLVNFSPGTYFTMTDVNPASGALVYEIDFTRAFALGTHFWMMSGQGVRTGGSGEFLEVFGRVELPGELTQINLALTTGIFDNGSWSVLW